MTRNGKSNGASSNGGKGNSDVRWFGQKLKRKEDPRLIKGISHYTDDFKPAGMLHCAFTRSPHAHAQIKSIRIDAARALPGVVAVFTAEDTTGIGPVPCAIQMPDLKVPSHPVLATGRVRYVGEPVAVADDELLERELGVAEQISVLGRRVRPGVRRAHSGACGGRWLSGAARGARGGA